jgi:serine protease Do
MTTLNTLKRTRLIAVATIAFIGGVFFASSMDWTTLLVAQPRASAPVVNMAAPGRGDVAGGFAAIAEQVTPAVVSIQAERDARPATNRQRTPQQNQQRFNLPPGFEQFFGSPDEDSGPAASSGTGFIVSKDGYVLTNNHVVEGMDRIEVHLTDRRTFKARIIGRDPTTDVAVIKIDGTSLPAVTIGDDGTTRVGEWVLAIGNPLGLDFTVTAGIVSAKGRSSERQLQELNRTLYAIQDFIQTDAAINPGNSGGPLVNARGEVIGINSAIASRTGTYVGYGFAIPITLAKTVMDDIIAHGRVRRAVMGASMDEVTAEDAAVNGLKDIAGAKIRQAVITDPTTGRPSDIESPAMKAGIEPGDVILSADGKKIDRVSTLQRILRQHAPGDVVTLDGMRYGEKKSFKVKLIELPQEETRAVASNTRREDPAAASGTTAVSRLGITVEALTERNAEARGVSDKLKGVLITSVMPGSPAAGLLGAGEVITSVRYPERAPVTTVADLQRELAKVKSGQIVGLIVSNTQRDGTIQSRPVNLRITD